MLFSSYMMGFGAVGSALGVASTSTSEEDADTTSHTVDMPAGVVPGDLLLAIFSNDGTATVTWGESFVEIFEAASASSNLAIAYKLSDGTEGADITVTSSGSEESAHIVYRIIGAADPGTQAPEVSSSATADDENPNPASLTPTGGPKAFLWIACEGHNTGQSTSAGPSGYSNLLTVNTAGGGSCSAASAELLLNATSENPGTFTLDIGQEWVAATIAVHPA